MRVTRVDVMTRSMVAPASIEPGVEGSHSVKRHVGGARPKQSLRVEKRRQTGQNSGGSVVQSHPWLCIVKLRQAWAT